MPSLQNDEIDALAAGYGTDFNPDIEAGLLSVRRQIDQNQQTVTAVRPLRRHWLSAAAAILLLLSVGLYALSRPADAVYANHNPSPLSVELPDGTRVVLQNGAELRHTTDFNTTKRAIALNGQGFFVVHKDASRPFLVSNNGASLRVTGTEFNLRVAGDELEVEVSEGTVELRQGQQTLAVGAQERGLMKANAPPVKTAAPHLNHHAWRTGKLYFHDAELADVLEALRTNFGLVATAPANCTYPISGTFSTEDPVAILNVVARLGGGKAEKVVGAPNEYRLVNVCQ